MNMNLLNVLDYQSEIFPIPREPSSQTPAHHIQNRPPVLFRLHALVAQIEDKLPHTQEQAKADPELLTLLVELHPAVRYNAQ